MTDNASSNIKIQDNITKPSLLNNYNKNILYHRDLS